MSEWIRRNQFELEERSNLGLTKEQYNRFKKLFNETKICNLPSELKEYHIIRTDFSIESLYVDTDLSIEVFADYVKNEWKWGSENEY